MGRTEVVQTVPNLKTLKGRLFCVDKDGDLCSFPRATGHYPDPRPLRKEHRLGIRKEKGWLYYLKGTSILRKQMAQFRKPKAKTRPA